MRSLGEYYKSVPTTLEANLRYRSKALSVASKRQQRALWEMCRDDALFYVNTFCCTYRPKVKAGHPRVVPFICRPRQAECLRWMVQKVCDQESGVVEKTREEGASWLACYLEDWLWRFHEWTQSLMVSRVGALVDSNSPDSLFWKLDFIQKWLPPWMIPGGWKDRQHRTVMYLGNPQTNSTITGQPTTQDIGIAGRATNIIFDEYSRVPNAQEVLDGTKDTADCRIWVSTHNGPGTTFAGLCGYGEVKAAERLPDKFVMHWSHNPEKNRGLYRSSPDGAITVVDKGYDFPPDYPFVRTGLPSGGFAPGLRSPWYDSECRSRSSRDVALNIDIDVAGATRQFFDRLNIVRLKDKYATDFPPVWVGELEYDRDAGKPKALIETPEGRLKLWIRPDGYGRIIPSMRGFGFGCDVAEGMGSSRTCLSGVDAQTGEKVLEFASARVKPHEFAPYLVGLGWLFQDQSGRPALVSWETPGPGYRLGEVVLQLGYGNIYYRKNELQANNFTASDTPGWHSNKETKRLLLEQYRDALLTQRFINRSPEALDECLNFKYKKDGYIDHAEIDSEADESGARINHGDQVIADALAWKMAKLLSPENAPRVELVDDPPEGSYAFRRMLRIGLSGSDKRWFPEMVT